jgi:hypothetical protein
MSCDVPSLYTVRLRKLPLIPLPSRFVKVEVEKQVLDSREKLDYCRSKMQDLVSTIVIWDRFSHDIKKLFLMINFLV